MKRASGLIAVILLSGSLSAQTITRSFGSVIFPGGTSSTNPNITRSFGSVIFPGGSPTSPIIRSGPAIVAPPVFTLPSPGFTGGNSFGRGGSTFTGGNSFNRTGGNANRSRRGAGTPVYAYPVYVPGYFDPQSYADPNVPLTQPVQQQPNVTVVYPQQQETARPIIIQMPQTEAPARPAVRAYVPEEQTAPAEPETPHYLIAFKDHTIYSSVAYWFDGDTLHYFTKGDTHNQAPVALIDRELTERLNREMGIDFKLPAAK